MKRTLCLLAVAALAVTPLTAEAAKKKPTAKPTKRVVTWSYQGVFGAYASAAGGGGICGANPNACFELPTSSHETLVTFTAADATNAKIAVQYTLDGDYDATEISCGSGSIPVRKGSLVNFYLVAGPDCGGGVATQGKITMTVTGKK